MSSLKNVEYMNEVAIQQKPSFWQRTKTACKTGVAAVGAFAVASYTNAAASLDFTGATEELTGVQTAVVGIIGTLVVLIGIGIAWSYFKRTAK